LIVRAKVALSNYTSPGVEFARANPTSIETTSMEIKIKSKIKSKTSAPTMY